MSFSRYRNIIVFWKVLLFSSTQMFFPYCILAVFMYDLTFVACFERIFLTYSHHFEDLLKQEIHIGFRNRNKRGLPSLQAKNHDVFYASKRWYYYAFELLLKHIVGAYLTNVYPHSSNVKPQLRQLSEKTWHKEPLAIESYQKRWRLREEEEESAIRSGLQ